MVKKIYSALTLFSIILLQFSFIKTAQAQLPAGTLDTTFSIDGKVITAVGTLGDEAHAVTIQTDGKIVVAGSTKVGALNRFALVRYNSDGTLDNSFGTSGMTNTICGPGNNIARAIVLQTDGKIVVVGNQENQTYSQFAIARYNTSGTLDNTFGSGGKTLTHLDYGFDLAYAVAIQPDGKIIAAGVSYDTLFNGEFGVVRYNTNGTLDNTFGIGGKVRTSVGTPWDQAQAVVIQPDGKIVVGGRTSTQMALLRYNANGTLDATFGNGGIVPLAVGTTGDIINALQLKPDGRILAGGVTQSGTDYNFILVQFDTNGNLDPNFGISGLVLADYGGTDDLFALAVQNDGNIVAAGSSGPSTNTEFTIARFDSIGNNDYTFNNQGFVTTPFGTGSAGAYAVALQSDGKIVAAGSAINGTYNNFVVARYFDQPVLVGVNELENNNSFTISPNPAGNVVSMSSNSNIDKVEVTDLFGKEIFSSVQNTSSLKIETGNWANGVYFVKCTSAQKSITKKLVVQH